MSAIQHEILRARGDRTQALRSTIRLRGWRGV